MFSKKRSLVLKGTMFYAAAMMLASCGSEIQKEEVANAPAGDTVAVASNDSDQESYSLPSPLQISRASYPFAAWR